MNDDNFLNNINIDYKKKIKKILIKILISIKNYEKHTSI